jgi:hypothetical protein
VPQVSWQQGGGERAGGEERVDLLEGPALAARREHVLDDDLFAPFVRLGLDHGLSAGDAGDCVEPVDGQLAQALKVRRGWRQGGPGEVGAPFGALLDDERVVVP